MDKMRKDLQAAHKLASESHSLDYYKDVLDKYQKDLLQQQKAKEPKAQATPAKKSKKAKAEAGEDEDVDMADDDAEEDEGKQKKSKKRKAEGSAEVSAPALMQLPFSYKPTPMTDTFCPLDPAAFGLREKA